MVTGDKPRQRHRQIKAQAQIRKVVRALRTGEVVGAQTAFEYVKAELFVIPTQTRVERVVIFHDRCFDGIKTVPAVRVGDDADGGVATTLIGWEEVPHSPGWIDRGHLPSSPEARESSHRAIEDERKFIDFKRSAMWFGKELVFIDRREWN